MTKVFFQYEETPFVYDIKHSKLCQIKNERLIKINEPNIFSNGRFNSFEIDEKQALILSKKSMR